TSDPVSVQASRPSNDFTLGEISKNKKKGTATQSVDVPGAGLLGLSGDKVKDANAQPSGAGDVDLAISATGKAKKQLKKKGKAKVPFPVTCSPTGGDPKTEDGSVKLVRKK